MIVLKLEWEFNRFFFPGAAMIALNKDMKIPVLSNAWNDCMLVPSWVAPLLSTTTVSRVSALFWRFLPEAQFAYTTVWGTLISLKKAPKVDRFIYITCKKKIICAWLILGVVLIEVCRRTPPRQSAQNEPPVRLALVYPGGFNFVLARQLSS